MRKIMDNKMRLALIEGEKNGKTFEQLASEYGMSEQAVKECLDRERYVAGLNPGTRELRETLYSEPDFTVAAATRTFNALMRSGKIKTLNDLKKLTPEELTKINGVGTTVVQKLKERGYLNV